MSRSFAQVDFTDIRLTAKIDYVTIATPGKIDLPMLCGTPRWSVKEHHKRLTIHDAAPVDIQKLIEAFDDPPILELEIAVDAAPSQATTREAHQAALERLFDGYYDCLHPYDAPMMKNSVMGMFNPKTGSLTPCDLTRPDHRLQVVWGLRAFPAQTKLYIKSRDGNKGDEESRDLPWQDSRTRVEVRLSGEALIVHDLRVLSDLQSFRVRPQLSPYFRIIRGSRLRARGVETLPPEARLARQLRQKAHDAIWQDTGAPGFREILDTAPAVFLRNKDANERIGNALARLERRLCARNSVAATS